MERAISPDRFQSKMNNEIKQELASIAGQDNYTEALIDLVSYSSDASDHRNRPEAAIWPKSADEISRIIKLANEHKFPVTARGAGTGMAGGAVSLNGGVVLDLSRMNRILEICIEDRLVKVEPGVVYADLQKALTPHGFFFPPDPASAKVCTLGGNVATNAGGIRGAKYGVTRDYVLGLEVVLPDGRIAHTGGRTMKSSSGLDLSRLFVGSEGVLGIITQITLKINPQPRASQTCQASFATLEQAGEAVSQIMRSGVLPAVMEIMDANTVQVLREEGGMDLPDARALLLVETDGFTAAEAEYQMGVVAEVFKANQAQAIERAETEAQAQALWKARKAAGSTAARLAPNNASEDVAVPISTLADFLRDLSARLEKYGLPFVVFGHAGDGNLHPKVMFHGDDPEERTKVKQAVQELFTLACQYNGTLTGEHGIGIDKAPFMGLEHDPVSMDLMRIIKRSLDPNNILNPGKMGLDPWQPPADQC